MLPRVNFEDRTLEGPGADIGTLIRSIYENLAGADSSGFLEMLSRWWDIYSVIAIILSLLFFIGFVYAKIRYRQLSEIESEKYKADEVAWQQVYGNREQRNNRWEDVKNHIAGDNPNDWRLAIIEADILLEETLEKAGCVGATVSDKLKSANAASFKTLQDAWDAHKVRNEIAHAGSDFMLTKRIAQDTIVQYERVFAEFGAI